MAQSAAVAGVQLAGELADGRRAARSQLRPQGFRREVMHEIRLYGELHRFVPVLAAARGFKVGEVVVQHRPRKFGRSKYGVSRIIKGLLDLLTVKFVIGYGQRPQHLLGTVGLASFVLGGLGMLYLAVRWCLSRIVDGMVPIHLHETAALYYSLALFMIGAQFMSIGFLGEMIAAYLVRESDTYSIAEHTAPGRVPRSRPDRQSERHAMTAASEDQSARLRWGIYLVLIAVAVGNMTGRLLAVNSVDKVGAREELAAARKSCSGRSLSANDRSRWMTIRSLVEHGTYEIDAIVGQPTWDTIDMVQHRGRDGELHLYSSKPPLLATMLAGEYWLIHRLTGWTLGEQPVRNRPADAVHGQHSAAGADVFSAGAAGRAVRHDRLGPHLRDGGGDARHVAHDVCRRAQQSPRRGRERGDRAVRVRAHLLRRRAALAVFRARRVRGRVHGGRRAAGALAAGGDGAAAVAAHAARNAAGVRAGGAGRRCGVLRHELHRPRQLAAALHASQRRPIRTTIGTPTRTPSTASSARATGSTAKASTAASRRKLIYAVHVLVGHHGIFSLTPVWLLSVWGMADLARVRRPLAARPGGDGRAR